MVTATSEVGDLATARNAWASRLPGTIAPAVFLMALLGTTPARAEDGYELWLRYHSIVAAMQDRARAYGARATLLVAADRTPTPRTQKEPSI